MRQNHKLMFECLLCRVSCVAMRMEAGPTPGEVRPCGSKGALSPVPQSMTSSAALALR